MTWTVEILDKANGKYLFAPENCLPVLLEWDDRLGCGKALIACQQSSLSLNDWRDFLGQDLRVYDESGRLAWWGYLERVEHRQGGASYMLDLAELANRVAVQYLDSGLADNWSFQQSAWRTEALSQESFGIRDKLLRRRFLTPAIADRLAENYLREHAFPQKRLLRSGEQGEDGDGFVLTCRSWAQSLEWRLWEGWNGVLEHRPSQHGVQALGLDAACLRLGQSFLVKESLEAFSLAVRIRKEGNPADSLRLSLRADDNNKPSGVSLASRSLSASEISEENYAWLELELEPKVYLNAGQRYWLVVERTGASDPANGFWLGMDENLGFYGGGVLLHNGAAWTQRVPNADLLFRFVGRNELRKQIESLVDFGGQFLVGIDTSQVEMVSLPVFLTQGQNCLKSLYDLLEQGNAGIQPLCLSVSPGRRLEIRPQKMAKDAIYYLEPNGKIVNRFGGVLVAPWQAVGEWLRSPNGNSVYISKLSLHPLTGGVNLNETISVESALSIFANTIYL